MEGWPDIPWEVTLTEGLELCINESPDDGSELQVLFREVWGPAKHEEGHIGNISHPLG